MPSALIQYNFSPIPRYMTHISLSLNCSKLFFVYMSFLYVRTTLSSEYPWYSPRTQSRNKTFTSLRRISICRVHTLYIRICHFAAMHFILCNYSVAYCHYTLSKIKLDSYLIYLT